MRNEKTSALRISDNAAEKIGELVVQMIEQVKGDWQKPWIDGAYMQAAKALDSKRPYNGINAFLLELLQSLKGYKTCYYITMNKVEEKGLQLNYTENENGKKIYEKAFPVILWSRYAYRIGESKSFISSSRYDNLSEEEKKSYKEAWSLKVYNVWNIDQTNFEEMYPDEYQKLLPASVSGDHIEDVENAILDYEIEGGAWHCPITQTEEGRAYYTSHDNKIVLPLRKSFFTATAFYGTALHEMSHSTGEKLGRDMSGVFGSENYAREELIAELSAAIVMNDLGLEKTIDKEHLQYLKSWSKVLKNTSAVKEVMSEVMSCVSYHHKAYSSAENELAKNNK